MTIKALAIFSEKWSKIWTIGVIIYGVLIIILVILSKVL